MNERFQVSFTINTPAVRRTQHLGRDTLIAPVVLLVEGVHSGSMGPMFYSANELRKSAPFWNDMPLPVFHPENAAGMSVSARSPQVMEANSVGRLYDVEYLDSPTPRLRGNLYIDIERCTSISPAVLDIINRGGQLDVSTGLYSTDIQSPGDWNGEQYTAVVTDMRPDHLALLPGRQGACSWADGCGVRANQENTGGDAVAKKNEEQRLEEKLNSILVNELSLDQQTSAVAMALYRQFDGPTADNYAEAIYQDSLVYTQRPGPQSAPGTPTRMFRRSYTIDENAETVIFGEEVQEVRREVNYTPVNPVQTVQNTAEEQVTKNEKEEQSMAEKAAVVANEVRKEQVNALIANGHFLEEDRDILMGMACPQFSRVQALSAKTSETVKANNAPVTFEDLIAAAPAEVRAQHEYVANKFREHRESLTTKIKANASNKLTDEQLAAMDIQVLEALVSSIPATQGSYIGAVGAPTTVNSQQSAVVPMGIPSLAANSEETKK